MIGFQKAYTLVELLVVIAIVGIVVGLAYPSFQEMLYVMEGLIVSLVGIKLINAYLINLPKLANKMFGIPQDAAIMLTI